MKYLPYLILMIVPFALVLNVFTAEQPNDANDIQDTWLPDKAEMGGQPMKDDFLKKTTLTLDNGIYAVFVAGAPDKGTYTIDSAAKPHTIDITGTEGPNLGRKIPAIYELSGDTLRVCYALGGAPRPTEFKTSAGTKYFLVTYHRKKL